ncbi:CapE family protein [Bacillus cereus]|nr:CapE family protein [Bacillus cereus]
MVKNTIKWLVPILVIAVLLITLGSFKRSSTITSEEQEKIDYYVNVE